LSGREPRNNQKSNGDAQQRIGYIESGPVFSGPIDNVDEIPHEAVIEETVIKIAAYPRREQSKRNLNQLAVNACE